MFCNWHEIYVTRLKRCILQQPSWVLLPASCGFTLSSSLLKTSVQDVQLHQWFMNGQREHTGSSLWPFCRILQWTSLLDLSWTLNTIALAKKSQQGMQFLNRLKHVKHLPTILTSFYWETTDTFNQVYFLVEMIIVSCSPNNRKT